MAIVNIALWLVLIAGAGLRPLRRRAGRALGPLLALLPLAAAANLTLFVFSEDDYRRNGISRWDAYGSPGGAAHGLYIACAVVCVLLAGLLAYAGVDPRRRALIAASGVWGGLAAVVLTTVTMIGYSLN